MTVAHAADSVFTNIELTGDNMAIFGNFKGTTKSEFQIGKSGNKINTGTEPVAGVNGDLYVDSANTTIKVFDGSDWTNIGNTLTDLNVDNGTLFVNSANDTVSIGSISSNEKLFVNGNLRLGTNPSLQHSGAYLDLRHSNGSTSQVRIRDNGSNTDPIFKVYNANNTAEVFKVHGDTTTFSGEATLTGIDTLRINENGTGLRMTNVGAFDNSGGDFRIFSTGNLILATNGENGTAVTFDQSTKDAVFQGNVTVNNAYTLPSADGTVGQVITTDGSGTLSFTTVSANPGGSNTQIQYNSDGNFAGTDAFTFDEATSTLETGVVKGVIFEPITDYGTITDSANMTIDYGSVIEPGVSGDFEYLADTFGPTSDSFSVNGLPSASQPGQMIYVSDETGGATMAFSDGTNWRRITDRAVVS
jgi:hypothetical protein